MGIDLLEIGMEIGEKLKFDDEKLFYDHIETVQDLCHAAKRILEEQHHSVNPNIPSKESIQEIVYEVISEVTGIPIDDISGSTRLTDICD